ncbi:tRNA glutamyl-Q(34) synthetase GluQRS [Roseibacterium sp. SDUM158016]|uniref:tRNA glutamyl-Q(34) synthetase GluQRS n=1 Tax=Roseicyclus sediminis TaxID=2980997 RepID=UPI0021CE7421|nr:tRNA glutamyl-Q(34) synthetase GluQRS [Roseibacterium sp. SDUM158016]MCU4654228.1 tRNA glutamyl-Q(34) synthetase GluQRS [Roseibacterium sp. SDUM158016]
MIRTRFAPSPTGPLHLGHAFSAILAHDMARGEVGAFLLRIEDIDRERSKPAWEALIFEDLAWLGLTWETPVMRQSDRMAAYGSALDTLWARGLLYPCGCNRRDILAAASAPQDGAPLTGPDGIVYPGTCRDRSDRSGPRPGDTALRLDMGLACRSLADAGHGDAAWSDAPLAGFVEEGDGPGHPRGAIAVTAAALEQTIGDVVLARRDMGTSYHLAVVIDDAAQGITHVTRGEDLFDATAIHVILQRLLGLPTPIYHHHRLIRDEAGKRLAKRDDARAISTFRAEGVTPQDIRRGLGLP